MSWYRPLESVESLGSLTRRPGSLGQLAAARQEHKGQFFTPLALSELVWSIVEPVMNNAISAAGGRVALFDNSVGSGRLFRHADPVRHTLAGADVHKDAIASLTTVAKDAGFSCRFIPAGMEQVKAKDFGVSLINPPFSLTLSSPGLAHYPCNTYGKYGPHTQAISHAYAVHHALSAAPVVVAIVPRTYAEECSRCDDFDGRLRAVLHVPGMLFKTEEKALVYVSILVFGGDYSPAPPKVITLDALEQTLPDFGLVTHTDEQRKPRLEKAGVLDTGPAITLPVTGNSEVRVVHDGRRIGLKFCCGLIQARVMNAVLRKRISQYADRVYRLPKGARYEGQAMLDVEAHLVQEDPAASFAGFLEVIRKAGGKPCVDRGLTRYFEKKIRQHRINTTPLRHVIYNYAGVSGNGPLSVRCKKVFLLDETVWGSPVIQSGEELTLSPGQAGRYILKHAGKDYSLSLDDVQDRFEILNAAAPEWNVLFPGLPATFPQDAERLMKRAKALGIDKWLTWGFQLHDLIEAVMRPAGTLEALEMGLGKCRLSLAIILLSEVKHGLLVVEAGLINELIRELNDLPEVAKHCKIIRTVDDTKNLARLNIISYERLRMPVGRFLAEKPQDGVTPTTWIEGDHYIDSVKGIKWNCKRRTYAHLLRRRVGAIVADEGGKLSNMVSDQSRSLQIVSAQRRWIMDGTPIGKSALDVLPLLTFLAGDGTACQPFGYHRAHLEPHIIKKFSVARRGVDAFREKFLVLEWVTNKFTDSLTSGAKRSVPKIARMPEFRELLSPHVKRRLAREPEVREFVKIPEPDTFRVNPVEWDDEHLAYYLMVAEDFRNWYLKEKADADGRGLQMNLVAVLARIQAVQYACSCPQIGHEKFGAYTPLTSKQEAVLERLSQWTEEGRKWILYMDRPATVDLFVNECDKMGIEVVPYHGLIGINARARDLDKRFRHGTAPGLIATLDAGQKGLNIPQADRTGFLNRGWGADEERQAWRRMCRPNQSSDNLEVEFWHLDGSIDWYQAQMSDFKADCADAALDYAPSRYADEEFVHIDTILGRFCADIAELRGVKSHELRQYLKQKAAA